MKTNLTRILPLTFAASVFAVAPVINSFTSDTPTAPLGSAIALRWEVNRGGDPATTITLVESGTDLTDPNLIGLSVQPASLISLLPRASAGWKYYGEEAAPPAEWKNTGFDDSAWQAPATAAPIAYGDTVTTTLAAPAHRKPFYFRRTFDVTADQLAGFQQFVLELVRDDGVVAYLNGTEIARNNMPAGEPTHDTFAAASVDANEDGFYRFPLAKSSLQAGTNTLAVAVYQRSATSSDIRFDAGILGMLVTTSSNNSPFASTWKYSADGLAPAADWNQTAYDDAAWGSAAGPFGFRDTNLNTVLSYGADANNKPLAHHLRRKFSITKVSDVQELRLWARYGDAAAVYLNGVRVDVPATDTTTTNFLGLTPHTPVTTTTVALADHDSSGWGTGDTNTAPRIVLTPASHPELFAALVDGENTIAVSLHPVNAADADLRFDLRLEQNTSADPLAPAVSTILPEFSAWKYLDGGVDPGAGWNTAAFDDAAWSSGSGNFGYGFTNYNATTALPKSTAGNTFNGKIPSYHFRRKFAISAENLATMLNARANLRVDDGYVLFVNGTEIARSANLPAGVIDHTTLTTGSRGEVPLATTSDVVTIPKSALVAGDNLIALELHQVDAASSDIWFDLSLDLVSSTSSPVYTLRASNAEGTVEKTFSPTVSAHEFTQPVFLNHNAVTANSWSSTYWSDGFIATADKDYQLNPVYGPILNTSSSVATFPGRSLTLHPGTTLSIQHSDTVNDLRLAGGKLLAGSTASSTLTLYGNLKVEKESILDGGTLGCSLNMPITGTGRLRLFSASSTGFITLLGASPAYAGSVLLTQGVLNIGTADAIGNAPVIIDNGTFAPTVPFVSTGSLTLANRFGTALVRLDQNVTFGSVILPSGSAIPAGTYTTATLPSEATAFFAGTGTLTIPGPAIVDTDSDGLDDTWEQANFGGLGALATEDSDNDGVNNLGEYIAGTDPKSSSSVLRIVPSAIAGGKVSFSLPTVAGASYKLQTSPNLGATAVWTDVAGASVSGDGTTKTLEVPAGTASNLFIRAVIAR